MKINIQMLGGRGASSSLASSSSASTQNKVSLNIPSGVTKDQERVLTNLYNNVVRQQHGSTSDSYELKKFDIDKSEYTTSVIIEIGLKNDEGTMASVIARDKAIIFIGKKGGMKHAQWKSTKLKPTKYIGQAFYDYTYRR